MRYAARTSVVLYDSEEPDTSLDSNSSSDSRTSSMLSCSSVPMLPTLEDHDTDPEMTNKEEKEGTPCPVIKLESCDKWDLLLSLKRSYTEREFAISSTKLGSRRRRKRGYE